jgi:hypothetical protein
MLKRILLAVHIGVSLVIGSALAESDRFNVRDEVTREAPNPGATDLAEHGGKMRQPTVFGKTYGEWSATWWQWAYAGPKGENVIEDETGELCAVNQPDGKVWFLAGSFGVPDVERTCTIPPDRALFYPLIAGTWTDCPGTPDEDLTDAEVRELLAAGDPPCKLSSTLDGATISSLQILTVATQSPTFASVLPKNSVIANDCRPPLPPGKTGRQISGGYWVMLPPLSPGKHTLTLRGAACDAATGAVFFETGVTYNLTVLDGHHSKR